jgi:hypothetical protein
MKKLVFCVALAVLAPACGGGGGGGAWLTFDPPGLTPTVYEGDAARFTLIGTAHGTPDVSVQAKVYVDGAVFSGAEIGDLGDGRYLLELRTLPTLSVGSHRADIQVRVCQDDPDVCSMPYDASPWTIPCTVTVAQPTSHVGLDFEAEQIVRWIENEDFTSTQAITLRIDDTMAQAGSRSLRILGPMDANPFGTDYITDQTVYLDVGKAPIDFTDRTLSAYFHMGTGTSSVDTVEVALLDADGRPCQGKYQTRTGDTWQHVTFNPNVSDQINYTRPGFDITQVSAVVFRISNPTGPVAQAVWNVDSVTW